MSFLIVAIIWNLNGRIKQQSIRTVVPPRRDSEGNGCCAKNVLSCAVRHVHYKAERSKSLRLHQTTGHADKVPHVHFYLTTILS